MTLALIRRNKRTAYRKSEKSFLHDRFCRVYFSGFSTVIPCLNIEVSFRNSFDRPKKNPLLVIERPLGDQKSSMADRAIEMLKKRLYIAFYKWIFASLDISGIIHSLNVCHFIT